MSKKRRKTRCVYVGHVSVGGENPVRIQSMTTSDTKDVQATVDQIRKLSDHGCEIARVTVQGKKEALSCELIKNRLVQLGCQIPVVADIHFYPPAALLVADFVEKVRINPGNFADRRATFKVLEYDKKTYEKELVRIEEKFAPLVLKCKKLKRSMRIGTNHGSLSDRIMNVYGDTPMGMVESALEYTRVCRKYDFHDIIFSMKSSNPKVMIEAYRLLVQKLDELGWDYPLHLGVTEAGEGQEGRIKSSAGIGSLLLDGLGDTIRVSLTEDPWQEIDPCKRLIQFSEQNSYLGTFNPYPRKKVQNHSFLHSDGSVILKTDHPQALDYPEENKPDILWMTHFDEQKYLKAKSLDIPIMSSNEKHSDVYLVDINTATAFPKEYAVILKDAKKTTWEKLLSLQPSFLLWDVQEDRIQKTREFFQWMKENKLEIPVILAFSYAGDLQDILIHFSAEIGNLLCDGIGEGVCIQMEHVKDILPMSFNALQACRMRTVKTEFISCPGCGRTLFDLQEVAQRIRKKTGHLPGVKIAIMGCIVNGPGEMADADFGYVGSKPQKVDLYVGKQCVQKDIDYADADEKLIDLIKEHGLWVEPKNSSQELLSV